MLVVLKWMQQKEVADMMTLPEQPREVKKIASGWAAFGDGWAVHAPTRESVLKEYKDRVKFYKELSKRPMVTRS